MVRKEAFKVSEEELQQFKELFSKYCRQEINKGHCDDGSCELCPVNAAYDEIFCKFADDPEEGEPDDA